jgi:predicted transposase/invertase (TIGR01784 family)
VRDAYEVANRFGWSKAEMELYDYWDIQAQDARGAIQAAATQARAEGREEGRQETQRTIVQSMLAAGVATSDIAQFTGMAVEEVEAIRGEMGGGMENG